MYNMWSISSRKNYENLLKKYTEELPKTTDYDCFSNNDLITLVPATISSI